MYFFQTRSSSALQCWRNIKIFRATRFRDPWNDRRFCWSSSGLDLTGKWRLWNDHSLFRHVPVRSVCKQFVGIRKHGRLRWLPSRSFVVVRRTSVLPTPAAATSAAATVVLVVGIFRGRRVHEHADGARLDGGIHCHFRHRCRIHRAAGCLLSGLIS